MERELSALVVHCKRSRYDVYIGRPSLFGNPFSIGRDGSREEVIERYRAYFLERVARDERFARAVEGLRGRVLGCWCRPLACHGDVIVEYLERGGER
jgi:hypothetical protein